MAQNAGPMVTEDQIKDNMDRMYRWTRHIYDASRKYYLLGRDVLIERLSPKNSDVICEVGCGTARNLIKMARAYPSNSFYGLDASDEMLKTASSNLKRNGLDGKIKIVQAFAQSFDPAQHFGRTQPFDKIVFSYALSIIPPWQESLDHALALLPKGGQLHIVDFGGQAGLPKFFRAFIYWWLRQFHVYYKPEIESYLKQLERNGQGSLQFENLYGGYCYHAVFTKA
jgi:S-adenosylmethionine-diacylgycerolhomoserine-N-methlytransferase